MNTLAHLVTDLFEALGYPPKEYLEPEDAVRAVRRSLAFYDLDLGQSGQNQVISKKVFTPTSREKTLADVRGVPLWLERKAGTGDGAGWPMVPAVNLAAVEDAWVRGEARCAFYSERGGLVVRLSYEPDGATEYRLWYDPDPSLEVTPADSISLPAVFYPMFTARAVRVALTTMLQNAAKCAENPPGELTLAAWAAAGGEADRTLTDYLPNWRQHKLASRGAARGRNRRPVLARSGRDF